MSNNLFISRSVPQDSILGPLLYSIYSNDLPTKLKFCNVQMYADDVQLYISCLTSDFTNCVEKINCDQHNVLQPQKSKALKIGRVNSTAQLSLLQIIVCYTIETVHNDNNLGVIINNGLTGPTM